MRCRDGWICLRRSQVPLPQRRSAESERPRISAASRPAPRICRGAFVWPWMTRENWSHRLRSRGLILHGSHAAPAWPHGRPQRVGSGGLESSQRHQDLMAWTFSQIVVHYYFLHMKTDWIDTPFNIFTRQKRKFDIVPRAVLACYLIRFCFSDKDKKWIIKKSLNICDKTTKRYGSKYVI